MVVAGMRWWLRKLNGIAEMQGWVLRRNAEVEGKVVGYDRLYTVSELKAWSLSSRNTLGDTTHNTNKIGLCWGGGSVWWASLCVGYGGGG